MRALALAAELAGVIVHITWGNGNVPAALTKPVQVQPCISVTPLSRLSLSKSTPT